MYILLSVAFRAISASTEFSFFFSPSAVGRCIQISTNSLLYAKPDLLDGY